MGEVKPNHHSPSSPWLSSRFSFSMLSFGVSPVQEVSLFGGDLLVGPRLMAMRLGAALLVTLPRTPVAPPFSEPMDPIDSVFFRLRIPALELLLVELLRFGPAASFTSSSSSSSSRRRFSASRSGCGGVWTVGEAGVEVASGVSAGESVVLVGPLWARCSGKASGLVSMASSSSSSG